MSHGLPEIEFPRPILGFFGRLRFEVLGEKGKRSSPPSCDFSVILVVSCSVDRKLRCGERGFLGLSMEIALKSAISLHSLFVEL